MRERLDDDVDRLARERALERGALGLQVPGENKIGRDAFVEPAPALDPIEGLRGPVDCCFAERRLRGIGDERGDEDGRHDASRRASQTLEAGAPHRRPDGERQVGGGARARRALRRDDRQRRLDASLPGSENPDRAADAGRGAARAPSPVRRDRRRGQFFGRPMGAGRARGSGRDRRTAGRFSSAARGFISAR